MWNWSVEWDLLLLAACMALCGLVPGVMAHLGLQRCGPRVPAGSGATLAVPDSEAGRPRQQAGLPPAVHREVLRQVQVRLEALAGAFPADAGGSGCRGACDPCAEDRHR